MFPKTQIEIKLDAEILSALEKLETIPKIEEDYGDLVDRIAKLHELKAKERPKKRISPDTALVVAANIFGILWLARYERENVIRSKSALGFVFKPRS